MHCLIVGTTGSGKSTLARMIAARASHNRHVLILDPLGDPAWQSVGATFITMDVSSFMLAARKNKNCHLIIDEAGEFCGQHDREAFWFATQSRHWGHKAHFISQRANMVAKNVRDNCAELFAFKSTPSDAKLLADDFCEPELLRLPELERGECLFASRFGGIKRLKIFS